MSTQLRTAIRHIGMLKRLSAIAIGLLLPLTVFAQSANLWYYNNGAVRPNIGTWGLMVPGLATSTTGCLSVNSTGWVSADGSACGTGSGGGGAWPFTPSTAYGQNTQSTSTAIQDTAGIIASSTSYFQSASSTLFSVLTNTWFPYITNSLLSTDSNGKLLATSTPTAAFFNATSTTASSTFQGLNVSALNTTGTASSTFSNGIQLSAGCFLIPQGVCVGPGGASGGGSSVGVNWATTASLPSNNYLNGVSGVGATITEVSNAALSVDGNSPAVGDRVLVKNEGTASHNGIYLVTAAGSGIAVFVLTRAIDYDAPIEISNGMSTYVVSGTTNGDSIWAVSFTAPLSIGSSNLTYAEPAGPGSFTGQFPIIVSGTAISWSGLATSSTWTQGGLATAGLNQNTLFTTATSAATVSSPLTGALTIVGTGQTIGIQAATAAQAGYETQNEFNYVHSATSTFTSPLIYTVGTNAVTCQGASGSQNGCLSSTDWNTFNGKLNLSNIWNFPTVFGTTTRATTTPEWFMTGLFASSTVGLPSWFNYLIADNATTTNATSTNVSISNNASTTNLWVSGLKGVLLSTDGNGKVLATTTLGWSLLPTSGVTAGAYTNCNCTVNAQGFITSASNGSGGAAAYPFSVSAPYNSTSTIVTFSGGLGSYASTTIGQYAATTTLLGSIMIGNAAYNGTMLGTTTMLQVSTSTNMFAQEVCANVNSGNSATCEMVFNNNLSNNTSYYTEMGINGGGYNQPLFSGQRPNDVFILSSDGGMDFTIASSTVGNASSSFRWLTGGNQTANIRMEMFADGRLVMGTSSPIWSNLTLASSTNPQLALCDGGTLNNCWSERAISNSLYFATSTSANSSATSTTAALAINGNSGFAAFGNGVGVASSTSWGMFSLNGSGFVSGGQFSVYDASSTVDNATQTVNWATGNTQDFVLNTNTAFVINSTSSNPSGGGGWYTLNITQDSTGSRTVTFITPGQLRWSNSTTTITGTAYTTQSILFHYLPQYQRYDVVASTTAHVVQN